MKLFSCLLLCDTLHDNTHSLIQRRSQLYTLFTDDFALSVLYFICASYSMY